MSIRTRLLLLVLGVWLPAVIGFGLLARQTYLDEQSQARHVFEDVARDVATRVEVELDKRAVPAQALAASPLVRNGDLDAFQREAAWAGEFARASFGLIDAYGHWIHAPQADSGLSRAEAPMPPPLAETGVIAFVARESTAAARPIVAIYVAAPTTGEQQRNVAATFAPDVIQRIVTATRAPATTLVAVIDSRQRLIGRNRDPERWLGVEVTPDVRQRIHAGRSGFETAVTLEGRQTLSYLSPATAYGWHVILGFPVDTYAAAARRLTLQAVAASALLLLFGLAIALYHARVVGRAVGSLRQAAALLGDDQVPARLDTGLREADMVGARLRDAGLRSREATRMLERRVAEAVRETEEAQSRLLEARKHEAIGRLTGGLAHDFNNLLQTINSALEIVAHGSAGSGEGRVVNAGLRACGKAAELVRQMLDFGRARPLRREPVALGDFLLHSQDLVAKAVGQKIRLSVRLAPDLPPIVVDPTQLELALLNLLFNARDAVSSDSRVGGTILIAARAATPADTEGLEGERFVCLEISDDGPGMDERTRARAFDPYYTTKPQGAGSGLGLAQVQAFGRQSGGDVRLRSEPGRGTTVCLVLPAGDPAKTIELPPAPTTVATRTAADALRVLMVEDDPLVSAVVVAALENAGHRVTLCSRADEAQRLLQNGEDCDVLFTDVVMPGRLTGLDLVDWCRVARPLLPAVLATGYSAERAPEHLALLNKPYAIDDLLDALHRAVHCGAGVVGDRLADTRAANAEVVAGGPS